MKWKKLEQIVAGLFGTVRTPFSGSNSGITASDSLHDRIYIECKDHAKQAILNLMRDTETKAFNENKIPILGLSDPEDPKQEVYVLFNIKDITSLIKEIDLNKVDSKIPKKTSIYKLIETQNGDTSSLFELKEKLHIEIKRILREKIVSGESLEMIENLGAMCYFLSTIQDYLKDEQEEDLEDEQS